MKPLTEFQTTTERDLTEALAKRGVTLLHREIAGTTEAYVSARVPGTALQVHIYENEAGILGPGVDERFEAPDWSTSGELSRAFIDRVLNLMKHDDTPAPAEPSARVVIAGGTGFLGLNLARYLAERGYDVILLSRHPPVRGTWRHAVWDGRSIGPWAEHLEGAAALVNLVGRTVDCIKTPDHCDEILRSRVEATNALGSAVNDLRKPLPVWVQMSTAHIYGDPPEVVCDESSPFGYGLAPFVGRAWEEAFSASVPSGTRQVILRTSFVLGRNGGALHRLVRLARLGLGGRVGDGRQGFSWIHELDMNRLFVRAITNDEMTGAYLATSPNPVSNAEFMRELRNALRVPFGLPAARWQVRLAARLVLRTDPELALYGRYCVSRRLAEEGFAFEFPALAEALSNLLSPGPGPAA